MSRFATRREAIQAVATAISSRWPDATDATHPDLPSLARVAVKTLLPDFGPDSTTPTGWDEHRARIEVRQIIDSYTLTMVGQDAYEYVEACADDVLHALFGWPVTYPEKCHLACPGLGGDGRLCVRRAGHIGPGLFCTPHPYWAERRDEDDRRRYGGH